MKSLRDTSENRIPMIKARTFTRDELVARNIAEVKRLVKTQSLEEYIRMRNAAFDAFEAVEDRALAGVDRTLRKLAARRAAAATQARQRL